MSTQLPTPSDGDQPAGPVDVVDGLPDRSSQPAMWKYLLLLAVFLAWVAFLVFCALAGRGENPQLVSVARRIEAAGHRQELPGDLARSIPRAEGREEA